MQFQSQPRQSPFSLTPWVKGLIVANVIVYFLTITVFTGAWVTDLLAFYPTQVGVRWWTFFTYMFVHGGFLHLVFNMLLLYFFGPALEERMRGSGFGRKIALTGILLRSRLDEFAKMTPADLPRRITPVISKSLVPRGPR